MSKIVKRVLVYFIIVFAIFFSIYKFHSYFLELREELLSYSLLDMYIFHVISSLIVYLVVELVYINLPDQTGYVYLVSVFLKIGIFVIIFNSSLLSEIDLKMFERLSIIVPMFLFLIIEAIFCSRLLSTN
ncbi:MAG: DUF6168 family protein [Cyclobacteriaceae bacterium]|nr:DUF6168 family protein [Cyclobacteriaceae bacterium]